MCAEGDEGGVRHDRPERSPGVDAAGLAILLESGADEGTEGRTRCRPGRDQERVHRLTDGAPLLAQLQEFVPRPLR